MTRIIAPFFCLFIATSSFCFAQGNQPDKSLNKNVRIVRDYRMDMLLEQFNKADKVRGFRIQIHSGDKRESARKIKSNFLLLFPGMSSYDTYQQPYFNVEVGDFLTKLEAQCFLNQLHAHFPNAYIVPNFIVPPGTTK
jgi:hypothetical protein